MIVMGVLVPLVSYIGQHNRYQSSILFVTNLKYIHKMKTNCDGDLTLYLLKQFAIEWSLAAMIVHNYFSVIL